MGIGPQQTNVQPKVSNDATEGQTIDELTKKLEDVVLQRSLRQEESRPVSGKYGLDDSLDTPIDLTKNDDDPKGIIF